MASASWSVLRLGSAAASWRLMWSMPCQVLSHAWSALADMAFDEIVARLTRA
jgi:hypothetical protein